MGQQIKELKNKLQIISVKNVPFGYRTTLKTKELDQAIAFTYEQIGKTNIRKYDFT